jgi:TrmH family RNA methyltransferase
MDRKTEPPASPLPRSQSPASVPTTSFSRQLTRQLFHLRQLRQIRRFRDSTRTFVIEGIRQFVQAHEAQFEFEKLFISPVLLQQGLAKKLARQLSAQGTRKVILTPEQFRSISTLERASGIIAIVKQRWTPLTAVNLDRGIGWLIVDYIRSPGNLGTILRTAEAVGISGIFFAGDDCDPHDPSVVRASMGGIFHLPMTRTRPKELSIWLAQQNIVTLGLSPHAERLWTNPPPAIRYALALGEERAGLSSALRRLCDTELRLPMTGHADSLNVSVAAGVMMYEMGRWSDR